MAPGSTLKVQFLLLLVLSERSQPLELWERIVGISRMLFRILYLHCAGNE